MKDNLIESTALFVETSLKGSQLPEAPFHFAPRVCPKFIANVTWVLHNV